MKWVMAVVLMGMAAGCNEYGYRYHPRHQPVADPVYADFQRVAGSVEMMIDTHGRRLTGATVVRKDGVAVPAEEIRLPQFAGELIGGMDGGRDPRYSSPIAQGPTVVRFGEGAIGAGPWHLRVELLGAEPVEMEIGDAGR